MPTLKGVLLLTITMQTSGFQECMGESGAATNTPSGSYKALIVAANSDTGLQITGGYTSDQLWFRGWHTSGAGYTTWRNIHSGNYTSYVTLANIGAAPASHSHAYLPLSGGTLTGRLNLSGGGYHQALSFFSPAYYTWIDYMSETTASTGGTASKLGTVTRWAEGAQ